MSSPLETPAFENLFVGDTRDDDAHVIDSLDIEVDAPATPVMEAIAPAALETPKKPTRLLTGTFTFDVNATAPVQLLPADPNRTQLHIDGTSFAATPGLNDFIAISDDLGKINSPFTAAWRLRSGKSRAMDNHTGAIYAFPGTGIATNNFEVTWVSVTS